MHTRNSLRSLLAAKSKTLAGSIAAALALVVLPVQIQSASAQNTTQASSAFGTRSLGGSQQSSRTTGSNSSATASMGQGGAMGQGQGQGGSTGSRTGSFVGGSQQSRRAVGNVMAGQGNTGANGMMGMGGMGQNMFGAMNRNNQNRNGQNGFGNNQNNSNQQSQNRMRVPLKLGFTPTPVATTAFSSKSVARINKLPAMKNSKGVKVSLEGTTAVLQGEVASEADRQLAEGLLMLEPEVSEVRNELVIRSTPPSVEVLPVPSTANSAQP